MRREDEEKERYRAQYDGWSWISDESEEAPNEAAAPSEAAADNHIVDDTIEEWMAELPERDDNSQIVEVKSGLMAEKPAVKIMVIE